MFIKRKKESSETRLKFLIQTKSQENVFWNITMWRHGADSNIANPLAYKSKQWNARFSDKTRHKPSSDSGKDKFAWGVTKHDAGLRVRFALENSKLTIPPNNFQAFTFSTSAIQWDYFSRHHYRSGKSLYHRKSPMKWIISFSRWLAVLKYTWQNP